MEFRCLSSLSSALLHQVTQAGAPLCPSLGGPPPYHLVTPVIIGIHIQVVTGQNHKAVGYEAFLSNVNLYGSLLPLRILGAASQEMANDELI